MSVLAITNWACPHRCSQTVMRLAKDNNKNFGIGALTEIPKRITRTKSKRARRRTGTEIGREKRREKKRTKENKTKKRL